MIRAIIYGLNYDREGNRRLWNGAIYYGNRRLTRFEETMMEVFEPDMDMQRRDLNVNTFSGHILDHENRLWYYFAGKRVKKYFDLQTLVDFTAMGIKPMHVEQVTVPA